MHRFSIFLVVAGIAAIGGALSVAENTRGTASDSFTSSNSNPALAEQDVTDAGVNLPLDIMAADVPCSPPSNNQAGQKQPSKFRRRQACQSDGSWDKKTSPNDQEQGQQPHQISNPDNTENNSSGDGAFDSTTTSYLEFFNNFALCNPLLVGITRKFLVCDSGRWRDRTIFQGSIDTIGNTIATGAYFLLDIAPGNLPPPHNPSPKITHVPGKLWSKGCRC